MNDKNLFINFNFRYDNYISINQLFIFIITVNLMDINTNNSRNQMPQLQIFTLYIYHQKHTM